MSPTVFFVCQISLPIVMETGVSFTACVRVRVCVCVCAHVRVCMCVTMCEYMLSFSAISANKDGIGAVLPATALHCQANARVYVGVEATLMMETRYQSFHHYECG